MTAVPFLTLLQIVGPAVLFGMLVVGGSSPVLARGLGRPRRPFRLSRRRLRAVSVGTDSAVSWAVRETAREGRPHSPQPARPPAARRAA